MSNARSGSIQVDDAVADGVDHGADAVLDAELGRQVLEVGLRVALPMTPSNPTVFFRLRRP